MVIKIALGFSHSGGGLHVQEEAQRRIREAWSYPGRLETDDSGYDLNGSPILNLETLTITFAI